MKSYRHLVVFVVPALVMGVFLTGCDYLESQTAKDTSPAPAAVPAPEPESIEFASMDTAELPREIVADLGEGVTMKLVLIPPGQFLMGSGESPQEVAKAFQPHEVRARWFRFEHPQHLVRFRRPFYMGAHEVTVGQFRRFVEDMEYKTDSQKDPIGAVGIDPATRETQWKSEYSWRNPGFQQTDDHPVVNVSWNDAVRFCRWLSNREGREFTLPTEAQWEYACRAGTTTRYACGDDPETLVCMDNVADGTAGAMFPERNAIAAADGYVFTAPVGQFQSNAFGLYDMHGNVWEWCADWYESTYYRNSPKDNPPGPKSGRGRVLRGGSWLSGPVFARSSYRGWYSPTVRYFTAGFRVCGKP